MYIEKLRIRDFRCLAECDLSPAPGLNLIVGDNASGKSSLLETIYYLSRGRSFRRTTPAKLIRRQASQFSLLANLRGANVRPRQIAAHHAQALTQFKLDGRRDVSRLDLVTTMPTQVIDPALHRLLEEGPTQRRQYLDWGVFHVEHAFYPAWRRYRRALQQRNRALKRAQPQEAIRAWDGELLLAAATIDDCRQRYLRKLDHILPNMVRDVLGTDAISVGYFSGWPRGEDYQHTLARLENSDREAGFTHAGPHRADLRIQFNNAVARDWVSRGQQKILTVCLMLAQARLMDDELQNRPILLIDDLAAELGPEYRAALFRVICSLRGQCFATFLEPGLVPAGTEADGMFHVEHGVIRTA